MIKYSANTVNDINYGASNMVKVYRNGAVCYYKVNSSGETPTYDLCYAVVDDITQYQDREFVDVFNKADEKWYKKNNLNQYEKYGIYGSGRTITTYDGKLTIDDGYEYQYSGSSWVNVGEVSGSSIVEYIETPSGSPYAGIELLTTPSSTSTPMYFEADYMFPTVKSDRVMPINQKSNSEIISYQMGLVMYSSPFYDYGGARLSTTYNDIGSIGSRIKIGFGVYSGDSKVEIRNLATNTRVASTVATPKNALIPYICNAKYNTSTSGDTFAEDCKIRYYGIKIYDNNVLVGNYIPAKNPSTDEYTLYETISQQYCSKIGTGTIDGSESGSTIYPVYYSEKTDPLDNLSFSSMTDANEYAYNNCVYDGMKATIDGTKYVFNSTEGWVEQPSRLPSGYTEVEYIQNTGTSYIEIDFKPNTNTRILTEMQAVSTANYPRLFGAGAWNSVSGTNFDYQTQSGVFCIHMSWFGRAGWSPYTSFPFDYVKHTYDLNKNNLYLDGTSVGSTSFTTTYQATDNLGVFTYINNNRPSSSSYWGREHFKGNMYSFKVYDNGTLVRDLVPCIKDSDNTVGAYDIVNDVFYTVPSGYSTDKFVAGPQV